MSEQKKIKILTISDHPLSPSGVGTQTRYMIEGLLATGKYSFVSVGGAVKHHDYRPQKTHEWGDDWLILPVDGYGNQEIIRSVIQTQKPDILWFMTDPRFYGWLWEIEDEIRSVVPMIYYHVWDNYPYPKFNKPFYDSNDVIATISKVTDDIVRTVSPEVKCEYIPHSVDMNVFKKLSEEQKSAFKKRAFPNDASEKMVFFWNSRNARRKQSGSLLWWFNDFLNEVGKDKARLIMHTDPKDIHGPDLEAIIAELGLTNGEVMFSTDKLSPQDLSLMYNMADATLAISDAEGFGLSATESLACETPIIVTMTGGLQEQVTDGEKWFGVGIEAASKAIIGSQEVPYIYEDRISKEGFLEAMRTFFSMSKEEREEMGRLGREHLEKNYNPSKLMNKWDELFTKTYEENGSWENRKNYKRWELKEI